MFFRAQTSAVLATATDFLIMVFCYQVLGLPLGLAVACGPVVGGIVNFSLNRYWSFRVSHARLVRQLVSYMTVCLVSAAANSGGVLLLVEYTALAYFPARVVVALLVALVINYPLHRFVVFAARGSLLED
ncbi:GtrA family protein [Porticoccus sp.]